MTLQLASVRRYPVKAMGGEDLTRVRLDDRGLVGDRWYAVVDADGRLASHKDTGRMRRRDAVAGFAARTDDSGAVWVETVRVEALMVDAVREDAVGEADTGPGLTGRWAVEDPALAAHLSDVIGATVRLLPEQSTSHQDDGAVSLVGTATLRWCAERWGLDADPRRLRVNLVVRTDEPFVEESWVGAEVRVGPVRLGVQDRVERCRTVDVPQDGTGATGRWLKPLAAERDMCLAVYAEVLRPGVLTVGDEVVVG